MFSPFFQKQNTIAKMSKRKTSDEGHSPPRKHNIDESLPKNQRCGTCSKWKRKCFGTPPFTVKCPACEQKGSICLPQGEKKRVAEGLPKDQRCEACLKRKRRCFGTPPFTVKCSACANQGNTCIPQGSQVDKGLPKEQRCRVCFRDQKRCFGTPPFKTKCTQCEKLKIKCFPQSEWKQRVDKGLPKEQRCQQCFRHRRRCFGTPPFKTSCRTCMKRGRPCKPRGAKLSRQRQLKDHCIRCASNNARCDGGNPCSVCIKRGYNCSNEKTKCRLPKDQCCNSCNGKRRLCDGEGPCSKCRKANTECRWTIGKETWIYRLDLSKWPKPTRMDYCAQCRKRASGYFGGPPMQCDGGFPCNCCLQQGFGDVRYSCTYHLGNGISKLYRLDDDTAAKARTSRDVKQARKRLARTKKTDDSDDKENIDDDSTAFQDNQKANPNDDDDVEQEGTKGKNLDYNVDPDLPEDAEQARDTDHDWSSERIADDKYHEDFPHDIDQSPMEIDSDDTASQIGQRQVRGSLGAANDVSDSLDQVGRPQELKPIPTNRKSSAKTVILERSRPTTLLTKKRNTRRQNANVMALTRRTSTRQRPWKIAKHA